MIDALLVSVVTFLEPDHEHDECQEAFLVNGGYEECLDVSLRQVLIVLGELPDSGDLCT